VALKWYTTVIDGQYLHAQARWWAGVLDWQLVYEADDEAAIAPKHEQDRPLSTEEWPTVGPALVFVPVPEGKTSKNRLHLVASSSRSQVHSSSCKLYPCAGLRRLSMDVCGSPRTNAAIVTQSLGPACGDGERCRQRDELCPASPSPKPPKRS
jgi:glyoxalase superfamily protein